MPRFLPEPPAAHSRAARTAVVLINLGTPQAPTAKALRTYLGEFLSDPRVVEIPRAIWWLILNGIILNTRPAKSAEKYAAVWTKDGSPLKVHTERQAARLDSLLVERGHQLTITWAMRYGQPSVSDVLNRLKSEGVTRILLVPMYPQYAASTSATALDAAFGWMQKTRNQPELRSIRNFHDFAPYLDALAASVQRHWQSHPRPDSAYRLIISFHGLPRRSLTLGDPYFCECQKTGRLLAERLGLSADEYSVCFQSRFGKAEWLQPYTDPTLRELPAKGVKRVDTICPGFVADCLETLEEIALEGKASFLSSGGEEFHYIAALNEDPTWIKALAELVETHLQGWPTSPTSCDDLTKALERARQLGAEN